MDNKLDDFVPKMYCEIEDQRAKIISTVLEDIEADNSFSLECLNECTAIVNNLHGYLNCCADLGYYESREIVNDLIKQFVEEIVNYIGSFSKTHIQLIH